MQFYFIFQVEAQFVNLDNDFKVADDLRNLVEDLVNPFVSSKLIIRHEFRRLCSWNVLLKVCCSFKERHDNHKRNTLSFELGFPYEIKVNSTYGVKYEVVSYKFTLT